LEKKKITAVVWGLHYPAKGHAKRQGTEDSATVRRYTSFLSGRKKDWLLEGETKVKGSQVITMSLERGCSLPRGKDLSHHDREEKKVGWGIGFF